ncbi:hypothetical protein [Marinobacter sp. F4218]|uniref:hypothetical protein n=1 Tax=Marinobacter sp. F4218 TaxID=2862868 RepID=UPI001C62ADE2|nr:hypothetical protein [Marinobacter sp. F4218]MBW7471158.1 hypothetical protein [Marinobacter sp. F4218]
MKYHTETYDNKLDTISIYQRYPSLKPFVGTNYGLGTPKVLLIAESHYLPRESIVHGDANTWYSGTETNLSPKEQKWICTRDILDKPLGGWKEPGHAIYRHLESALLKAGLPARDSVFRQVAFVNAFQRPAKQGASIKITKQDFDIAVATINEVIDALQPDHVVFISTKARRSVGKRLSRDFVGVHHPACPWWNRKQNGISSKERFINLLSEYWKSAGVT